MKIIKIVSLALCCSIIVSCSIFNKTKKDNGLLNASHFLIDGTQTNVMLLGTWHFSYPNHDSHKTEKEDMVDLESPKRQDEIREVVEHLQKFKPTIICIETSHQDRTDSLYNAYLDRTYQLSISEDEQLGFRLAKILNLKKVHATDTYSWLREEYKEFPILDNLWDEEYYLDTLDMLKWGEKYEKLYNYKDEKLLNHTVNECLKHENHPENLKASFGHYLVELKTSNHNGPDALSLKWYDRNVRIFNNILKTNPKPEDRILVIYGSSHISILEQLFDASPQFKLVRPYDY